MKKILFTMLPVLLLSCSNSVENNVETLRPTYTKEVDVNAVTMTGDIGNIKHFEYNGHQYIQFTVYSGYGGRAGFVHDPDCPCHLKTDSVKTTE